MTVINDVKDKLKEVGQKLKKDHPMESLLNQGIARSIPKVGDLVEGIVISIAKNEVLLDIDGLTTGVIRGKEIYDESGEYSKIKQGEKVSATVLELENEKGRMELSFRYAGHQKAWERLEKLMKNEEIVEAKIIDANKGGLMTKVGNVMGFLPVSQLNTEHYPRVEGGDRSKILGALKKFIGQSHKVKIIDVNETEEKLIVSERAAWEEKQQTAMEGFKLGDVVEGKVTAVVDFGAFIEFGKGLEGLVHISELAWQRIDDPNTIVKVGDKIKAEIISVEGSRVSLSMKKLVEDPWVKVAKKYKVNQKVKGKVLKINPFGAFIELDKDIHGLAHVSELGKDVNNPKDMFEEGKDYEFTIISIDPKDHRLGLAYGEAKRVISKKKGEEKIEEVKAEKPKKEVKKKEETKE